MSNVPKEQDGHAWPAPVINHAGVVIEAYCAVKCKGRSIQVADRCGKFLNCLLLQCLTIDHAPIKGALSSSLAATHGGDGTHYFDDLARLLQRKR